MRPLLNFDISQVSAGRCIVAYTLKNYTAPSPPIPLIEGDKKRRWGC